MFLTVVGGEMLDAGNSRDRAAIREHGLMTVCGGDLMAAESIRQHRPHAGET
jgi:hypothetical protein